MDDVRSEEEDEVKNFAMDEVTTGKSRKLKKLHESKW